MYKSYTSFVKYILKYFISFYVTVNGIIFRISCSRSSLQEYRNVFDFYIFIIYHITFINSFITGNCVFVCVP